MIPVPSGSLQAPAFGALPCFPGKLGLLGPGDLFGGRGWRRGVTQEEWRSQDQQRVKQECSLEVERGYIRGNEGQLLLAWTYAVASLLL